MVRVVYIGRIQETAGCREETLEASPGCTVLRLLDELGTRHGTSFRRLAFDDGSLARGLNILVNGVNVTERVCRKDGETLALFPDDAGVQTEVELVLLDLLPAGGV